MSHAITVYLSDEVFGALQHRAVAAGTSPASVAAAVLSQQLEVSNPLITAPPTSNSQLADMFGIVNVPEAAGANNEQIDQDLAREYAANHESE